MTLELWYDKTLVGRIEGPFEHQGTWFGDFLEVTQRSIGPMSQRLGEYMDFCHEWYARAGSTDEANAEEFNSFDDILCSGRWFTIDQDGFRTRIVDAPMFMDGRNGEISWVILSESKGT